MRSHKQNKRNKTTYLYLDPPARMPQAARSSASCKCKCRSYARRPLELLETQESHMGEGADGRARRACNANVEPKAQHQKTPMAEQDGAPSARKRSHQQPPKAPSCADMTGTQTQGGSQKTATHQSLEPDDRHGQPMPGWQNKAQSHARPTNA